MDWLGLRFQGESNGVLLQEGMAIENLGVLLAHSVQFVDRRQFGGGPAGSHTFAQQLRKAEGEIRQCRVAQLKNREVEVERLSSTQAAAIKMRCADYEGPGPVRQSTWPLDACGGFEQTRIGTVVSLLAGSGSWAVGPANKFLEGLAQSSANHVAGFTRRKVERLKGAKAQAKGK